MTGLSVVGLSHKSGALALRELLAAARPASVLDELRRNQIAEAIVLSTCNRFEIYSFSEPETVKAAVVHAVGASLDADAYVLRGADAVRHLFEVAAGLDSLVVGETEILGQVKSAYELAKSAGMTGKRSNVLFQRALYTGKKVRSDTAIAVGQTSVASVAVQLAESIFGSLRESQVLILGAGAMAELTARHMLSQKVSSLTIANRTLERGQALADRLGARALPWERFEAALGDADIVIASTGSPEPVVRREAVAAAMARRAGRSLFLIDIAMPRDVEETVHGLENVYVYRLEHLEAVVSKNLQSRTAEISLARAVARAKADELHQWLVSVAAGKEISLKHSNQAEEAVS